MVELKEAIANPVEEDKEAEAIVNPVEEEYYPCIQESYVQECCTVELGADYDEDFTPPVKHDSSGDYYCDYDDDEDDDYNDYDYDNDFTPPVLEKKVAADGKKGGDVKGAISIQNLFCP